MQNVSNLYLHDRSTILVLEVNYTIEHEILGGNCAPEQAEVNLEHIVKPENAEHQRRVTLLKQT